MSKRKYRKKCTVVQCLIDNTNTDNYRSGSLKQTGRSLKIDSDLLKAIGGRENLVRQAKELEKIPELHGKISYDWEYFNTDISAIHYKIDIIPILCKLAGIEDPQERQKRNIEKARAFREDRKGTWLEPYFRYVLEQLEKGNTNEIKVMEDDVLLHCLREMSLLQEPEWKRVFSARVFKACENVTPSKVFEKVYQGKILEVQFLKKIREAVKPGTRYEHWGDMDYGGIHIFLYNERNIFPELEPYRMSEADYVTCIQSGKGISLEEKKRKKLEALDAGKLEPLKEAILKNGIEIEQEMQIKNFPC